MPTHNAQPRLETTSFRRMSSADYPLYAQLQDGIWGGEYSGYRSEFEELLGRGPFGSNGDAVTLADIDGQLIGVAVIRPDRDADTGQPNWSYVTVAIRMKPGHTAIHPRLVKAAAPASGAFLIHSVASTEADRFDAEGWRLLAPGESLGWCEGDSDACVLHSSNPLDPAMTLAFLPLTASPAPHWAIPPAEHDLPALCRVHHI